LGRLIYKRVGWK